MFEIFFGFAAKAKADPGGKTTNQIGGEMEKETFLDKFAELIPKGWTVSEYQGYPTENFTCTHLKRLSKKSEVNYYEMRSLAQNHGAIGDLTYALKLLNVQKNGGQIFLKKYCGDRHVIFPNAVLTDEKGQQFVLYFVWFGREHKWRPNYHPTTLSFEGRDYLIVPDSSTQ